MRQFGHSTESGSAAARWTPPADRGRRRPTAWNFLTAFLAPKKATVTSKGQITIPLPIRRKLNLHKGAVLEFDESADHLEATKCVDVDRMRSAIGIAREELGAKSTAEWLDVLRGPAELPRRQRRS